MNSENSKTNNNNIDQITEISIRDIFNDIKDLYLYFKKKWLIILTISLLGALIGFAIAWLDKPVYKANLTFAMEEDKSSGGGLGGAMGLASSFGIDLGGASGGGAFAASNLSELMRSRLIVEKVLLNSVKYKNKELTLAEFYIEINDLRQKWKQNNLNSNIKFLPNSDRTKFSVTQDSVLKLIYLDLIENNHIGIQQKDKKVSILTIDVNSENEFFSKFLCENIAKETSDFYIKTKSKKAKLNVDVLQKQVDSIRQKLNGTIYNVARESDNIYNLNPAFNSKGVSSKKLQIDIQANTNILTNLTVQLELAKITLRKETPLIQIIDTPILPLEKDKLGKLKTTFIGSFLAFFLIILLISFSFILNKIRLN
jgi:uncharacterized protein involved in exopolysaccharide biosynthesis